MNKESLVEAFTQGAGTDSEYGVGWETWKSAPSLKQIHHSGKDHGTKGIFGTFPEHKLTVILLANFNEFLGKDMKNIIDIVINLFLKDKN